MPAWIVIGFTSDDIIGGWQDSRLAQACVEAWRAEGQPPAFVIRQGAGQGEHFIYWYLTHAAAGVLDRHAVDWRRFLVGERPTLPSGTADVLDPAS
jgi:hypothetical protein